MQEDKTAWVIHFFLLLTLLPEVGIGSQDISIHAVAGSTVLTLIPFSPYSQCVYHSQAGIRVVVVRATWFGTYPQQPIWV